MRPIAPVIMRALPSRSAIPIGVVWRSIARGPIRRPSAPSARPGAARSTFGGYWIGVFYRGRVLDLGRDLLRLTGRGLRAGYRLTAAQIGPRLRPFAPSALFARGRQRLWRALPSSWHVIARVRHANRTNRPNDWYPRFAAAPYGGPIPSGEANQPAVIAQICTHRPGVDMPRSSDGCWVNWTRPSMAVHHSTFRAGNASSCARCGVAAGGAPGPSDRSAGWACRP
ncbi:MAG: hypothetical protein ACUVQI_07785 [Thermochromatium sp.]